jgi:hypothetical protein
MKKVKTQIIGISLLLLFFSVNSFGQIVCADVDLVPSSGEQSDFVFDSFGKYIGGITYHGAVKINVEVDDQAPPNPDCKWMLTMSVENNPSSGSGADEWETLTTYGAGNADVPKIEILEVRITNGCATSPADGVYQSFTVDGDYYEIIENTGLRIDAGSCITNVNGPGSFLTNYSEFSFMVDFRIVPGFDNAPGIYQLQVKFELVEVP